MGLKTAGVGHFAIPTAPAAGTSCTSGAANVFTTNYVQLIASTAAALYITGVHLESSAALAATYIVVQLATGAAASETIVGQYLVPLSTASTVALGYRQIYPPIPVANGIRIACKTADSVGAKATLVTLECIAQSNVVDDGIAITTVTTVTNQLTAAAIATGVWQDATAGDFTTASSIGKALYIANVAPGASGGHMISGSNAGTTTLGALTVTGATTLTGNMVLSDGLTISAPSTADRAGIDVTGNGAGAAMKLAAGATGKGVAITTTAGDGLSILPTAGHAIVATGQGTTKHGISATGGATSSAGISAVGGGSGNGITATAGATGHGLGATGGATSGDGINASGPTSGHGISATAAGAAKHGISGISQSASGIAGTGGGSGNGIRAVGGATDAAAGIFATCTATNATGIVATGTGTGAGVAANGGSTSGNGINAAGGGSGIGFRVVGGSTGIGMSVIGGATSGDGIKVTTTSGHGINLAPVGTDKHGLFATGGNGGTSDGIKAVAGTGGVDLRANITGDITGALSGAVGSVTGNVGGNVVGSVASVTAAVTLTAAYDAAKTASQAGDAMALTAGGVDDIWDEPTAGHTTAGTTGKALIDAGSAGDPWGTSLPGAYAAGTAGFIIGTYVDAAISSRLATSGYTAPLTAITTRSALGLASANLDTQLAAIQSDTDDIQLKIGTPVATLAADIAAIYARTDVATSTRLAAVDYTTPPTTAQIADKMLGRNLAGGSDGTRTVQDALRAIRNKTALDVLGGTFTVYEEDDMTPAWTAAVTTATRDPLTSIDPT